MLKFFVCHLCCSQYVTHSLAHHFIWLSPHPQKLFWWTLLKCPIRENCAPQKFGTIWYISQYTHQSRPDISVHCSIGIFRPTSDIMGRHWRVHTHILLFIQRAAKFIAEHPYYLSMASVCCSQQGSESPLCKEQEKYCTAIMSLNVHVCVWSVWCLSWIPLEQREGQTSLLDPWGRVMKGRV